MGIVEIAYIVAIAVIIISGFKYMPKSKFYLTDLIVIFFFSNLTLGSYVYFYKQYGVYRDEIGKAILLGIGLILWIIGCACWSVEQMEGRSFSATKRAFCFVQAWSITAIPFVAFGLSLQMSPLVSAIALFGILLISAFYLYFRTPSEDRMPKNIEDSEHDYDALD